MCVCVLFRFRRGQENITNRFWLALGAAAAAAAGWVAPPSRPLAFLRGIQPIDRLHSLVKKKKIKQQRKKNDAQTNYANEMKRNEQRKKKFLPKMCLNI